MIAEESNECRNPALICSGEVQRTPHMLGDIVERDRTAGEKHMSAKRIMMAVAAILTIGTLAAKAQPMPPGNDPYGYYSRYDHNGYYDRDGRYRRIRHREREFRERDDDDAPPPPPPPPALLAEGGSSTRRGEISVTTSFWGFTGFSICEM